MEIINIQILAGIATLLGIWLSFWQYRKNLYDRQKQVLVSFEAQLNVASIWSSVNNDGYIGSPDEERKLDYANPFRFIYGIENFALKEALTQIGSIDFRPIFHNILAEFIQSVSTMSDQQRIREQIGLSNIDIALLIREKLNLENSKPKAERSLTTFLSSFNVTDEKEKKAKEVSEIVYNFNLETHYKTIGSEKSGGLKTSHHILLEEIKSQREKLLEQRKIDHALLSAFLLPIILGTLSIFNLKSYNLIQITLLIIVSILFYVFQQINTNK